ECFAQFRDRSCQNIIGYDGVRPDRLHELFFRYHLSCSVGQALKHLHYLRFQPRRLVISGDSVELRLNEKLDNSESAVHHHPPDAKSATYYKMWILVAKTNACLLYENSLSGSVPRPGFGTKSVSIAFETLRVSCRRCSALTLFC